MSTFSYYSYIKRTVELQNLRETFAKIQDIKSSQTWIQPVLQSSKVIGPWKAATFELNFDTEQMPMGEINVTLTVQYVDNAGENKTLTLPISGKVNKTYTLIPNRFFFGRINAAEENTKAVDYDVCGASSLSIDCAKLQTKNQKCADQTFYIGPRLQSRI